MLGERAAVDWAMRLWLAFWKGLLSEPFQNVGGSMDSKVGKTPGLLLYALVVPGGTFSDSGGHSGVILTPTLGPGEVVFD